MQELNTNDFSSAVLEADQPVLVDFWAEWCGPCRMLSPILDKLADEIEGITISRLNVDDNQQIAGQYGVQAIPTMIIFKDGEPVKRLVGLLPPQKIKAEIESVIA